MATATVTEATPKAETSKPFFSFNASYTIDPDATNLSLINDAQCWIGSARAIVETVATELDGQNQNAALLLYAARDLLSMIDGAVGALKITPAEEAQS